MTTIRLRALVATSTLCLVLLASACDSDDGGSSGSGGTTGSAGRGGTTGDAGTTGNAGASGGGTFGGGGNFGRGGRGDGGAGGRGSGGMTAGAGRGGGTGGAVWDGGLPDAFNLDAALADAGVTACAQGVAMGGACTQGTDTACRPASGGTVCICQNAGTWRCF